MRCSGTILHMATAYSRPQPLPATHCHRPYYTWPQPLPHMASGVWRRLAMEHDAPRAARRLAARAVAGNPDPSPNLHPDPNPSPLRCMVTLTLTLRELSQVTLTPALTSSLTLTLAHCDAWQP